jgi:protein involved in polysaccharide export with SLBB domain
LGESGNAQNTLVRSLQNQTGQAAELDDASSVPAAVQRQVINSLLESPAPGSELARQLDNQAKAQQQQLMQQQVAQQRLAQQQADAQAQIGGVNPGNPGVAGPIQTILPPHDLAPDPNEVAAARSVATDDESAVAQMQQPRNFVEQSTEPGRFDINREIQTFGQLSRQLGVDPVILVNFLIDNRIRLDGAVRGPGYYLVGQDVMFPELLAAAGGAQTWVDESSAEVITTAVDPASGRAVTARRNLTLGRDQLASYILRSRDQIRVNRTFADVGVGSVFVQGEVRNPGKYPLIRGEHLSDLISRAGGLTATAYPYGSVFLRQSAAQTEREGYNRAAGEIQSELIVAMTRVGNDKLDPNTFASMQTFVAELRNQPALGRISVVADPSMLAANAALDPLLEPGDVLYVPQRPSTISVLGQVLQAGSFPYRNTLSVADYIELAGGYSSTANKSGAFVVLPDGTARRIERSWFRVDDGRLPPGSVIVVPRDVTPLDLRQTIIDVSQILSQFAVSIASIAVLAKQ